MSPAYPQFPWPPELLDRLRQELQSLTIGKRSLHENNSNKNYCNFYLTLETVFSLEFVFCQLMCQHWNRYVYSPVFLFPFSFHEECIVRWTNQNRGNIRDGTVRVPYMFLLTRSTKNQARSFTFFRRFCLRLRQSSFHWILSDRV